VYQRPAAEPRFGDVFAAEWFFDINLRRDAVALHPFQRKGGLEAFEPAEPRTDRDLVLAHGKRFMAVLLSDDCEVESVLKRRRRGRLCFAAIEVWSANHTEDVRSFRRHPLPPGPITDPDRSENEWTEFAGGEVQLSLLFAVSHEAVSAAPDPRIVSLTEEGRSELEIRWAAYATRRGPRAQLDNAEKLSYVLSADGDAELRQRLIEGTERPSAAHRGAGLALARALAAAWRVEGQTLNDVALAFERSERAEPSRAELRARLEELAARATEAAEAL
jgi:hypothetical protein